MTQITSDNSFKIIFILIAVGIWAIVLQNAGLIPLEQNVRVVNTVDTYVEGGNIDISGAVEIDNTSPIPVSIDEVLGRDGKKYYYRNY